MLHAMRKDGHHKYQSTFINQLTL